MQLIKIKQALFHVAQGNFSHIIIVINQ